MDAHLERIATALEAIAKNGPLAKVLDAVGGKPAAATKPAAAAAPAPATKPAAAAAPAKAGRPALAIKPPATPGGHTKGPGGKHTQDQVRDMLRKVATTAGLGKQSAIDILTENAGGATSFNNLKPEFYDAVFEGCESALASGEGGGVTKPADDDLGIG
jgi:hypothetical protein